MLVRNKMLHMAKYRRYIEDISAMYRRYRVDLGACEIGDIESINRRYRYAPQKNRSAARIQRKTSLETLESASTTTMQGCAIDTAFTTTEDRPASPTQVFFISRG